MSSVAEPGVDVVSLTPGELEALAREMDRERCRQEAAIATLVHRVGVAGAHLVDGHRTPKAWGRAACNWSSRDAGRTVRLGAMLARFPSAAALAVEGRMGIGQMHALAALVANPRVSEHLDAGEAFLVGRAVVLDYDDYVTVLARWEANADADGAHDDHERAHRHRKANANVIGDQFMLDACGGAAAGAQMVEILNAFAQTEWWADWDAGVREHGDEMCPGRMERSDAQRRFDALVAIFHKAAAMDSDPTGTAFTVNIMVGHNTFEHHLTKALGGEPAPLDPNDPLNRCETEHGTPIDPYDMLIAAGLGHVRRVVLDAKSVVVDMGRKQRLFTGALREAVLMNGHRCIWPGCYRPASGCEADHVLPWANAGPTSTINGAPTCGHHNRWRTRGYRTWRDPDGHWHHTRPDGTELGWRTQQPEPATT